jgi:hypothetical protein
MEEVRGKYVSPAIDQLAFNCPHCDALARQFWFSVHADPLKSDEKPVVATAETVKTFVRRSLWRHQCSCDYRGDTTFAVRYRACAFAIRACLICALG